MTDSDQRAKLSERLLELENQLKVMQLWEATTPTPEALASEQPFCVDTLRFPQWLQHVYLPKLRACIHQQQSLPKGAQVAPMAQEYFKNNSLEAKQLILHIAVIDHLLR